MQLTMLNSMAGADFELAARRHAELGLKWLDLKDELCGQSINELSFENAHRVNAIASANGLKVHCLSSSVGYSNLAEGEVAFREKHLATLDHVLQVAQILQPQVVRLLGATLFPASPGKAPLLGVEREFPWVFEVYRQMIDRIRTSGFAVGIENEVHGCILASVADIQRFFELTSPDGAAYFIYDVQNLWQMGTFPTLEVYHQLKPLMGGLHLKGGRTKDGDAEDGRALYWASPLTEASWPVVDFMRAVASDGVAPVICLNPSHGQKPEDYDLWDVAQRDIKFLRHAIQDIE